MWRANPWRGAFLAAAVALLACVGFGGTASAADAINLTGKWNGDDGGTLFIRQVGNEVWRLGQSGNGGADWTNVLHGTIRGRTLVGDWADAPAGPLCPAEPGASRRTPRMAPTRWPHLLRHLHRLLDGRCADGPDDAELLRRFAEGRDEAAFEVLVWRHGPMVHNLCRRLLRRA